MSIQRISSNPNFLVKSGPILFIYGHVVDEFISASDYVPKNIEYVLVEYLIGKGFDRVVFYQNSSELYTLDERSWLLSQPKSSGHQTNEFEALESLADGRPLGDLDLFEAEENEKQEDNSYPLGFESKQLKRMLQTRTFDAIAAMNLMMNEIDYRTAVIIPHYDELELNGEAAKQLQDRLKEWVKLSSIFKNKCIIISYRDSIEGVLGILQEKGNIQLHHYLDSKRQRAEDSSPNEALNISTPHADEIQRMIQRRRLLDNEAVDWLGLPKLIKKLQKKRATLRELAYAELHIGSTIEPQQELSSMIGLTKVKQLIMNELKITKLISQNPELNIEGRRKHLVFTGNPGTGKTSVAKLLGEIYKEEGILYSNNFHVVSRENLVARYVGQTAPLVVDACEKAKGGILFIDEAYTLYRGEHDEFGLEALNTLNRIMEEWRDDLMVIWAGYADKIEILYEANPGLRDRFPTTIEFEDYNADELFQIFNLKVQKAGYLTEPALAERIQELLRNIYLHYRDDDFGNARVVDNLVKSLMGQALVRMSSSIEKPEKTLLLSDVPTDYEKYFVTPNSKTSQNLAANDSGLHSSEHQTIPASGMAVNKQISDASRSLTISTPPSLPIEKLITSPPNLYFAFAHHHNNPLPALHEEFQIITQIIKPLDAIGAVRLLHNEFTTEDTIFNQFNEYRDKIQLFHYGGHADGQGLDLNDKKHTNRKAHARGLASLFSQQRNLHCVFLNGCATFGQVQGFIESGVEVIIATYAPIGDAKAKTFASAFYQVLVKGQNLEVAFEHARAHVLTNFPNAELAKEQYRAIGSKDSKISDAPFSWGIFYKESSSLKWSIPTKPYYLAKELTPIPKISNDHVIGREKEIGQIHHHIQEEQVPLVLQGMGGIGKSVLAKAYLNKYIVDFDHVIWVDGHKGIKLGLLENLELLEQLGLTEVFQEYRKSQELLEYLFRILRDIKGKNLLIIDDAANLSLDDLEKLPQGKGWHVIITAREEIYPDHTRHVRIEKLDFQSAKALFSRHFELDQTQDDDLRELFGIIDYHPLVLELLAKTTAHNYRIEGVPELIQYLQKPIWNGPELEIDISVSNRGQRLPALKFLLSVFSLASDGEERERQLSNIQMQILRRFSILPPQYVSGEHLIKLLGWGGTSEIQMINELNDLARKGWLESDAKRLRMHPLIRTVCRIELKPDIENTEEVIDEIDRLLSFDHLSSDFVEAFQWTSFGESIIDLFGWKHERILALALQVSALWNEGGESKKVISALEGSLTYYLAQDGEIAPSTLAIQLQLGIAYRQLGKIEESQSLLKQSALVYRELIQDKDQVVEPQTNIYLQENLGVVQLINGEYKEAKDALENALEVYQELYGETNHNLQVYFLKILLSHAYRNLGQLDEAEALANEIKFSLNTVLDDSEHPLLGRVYFSLAMIKIEKGEQDIGLTLLNNAYDILVAQYGEYHPEMAAIQTIMCLVNMEQGEVQQALDRLTVTSQNIKLKHGLDHPLYAECKLFMGLSKSHKAAIIVDDPNLANELTMEGIGDINEAMQILNKTNGVNHPFLSASPTQMGMMAMNTNTSIEEVESLFLKGYEQNYAEHGSDHLKTLDSHFGLLFFKVFYKGHLHLLKECEEVLNKFVAVSRTGDMDAAIYTFLLSFCYKLDGNYSKTEELFGKAKQIVKDYIEDDSWSNTIINMFEVVMNDIESI